MDVMAGSGGAGQTQKLSTGCFQQDWAALIAPILIFVFMIKPSTAKHAKHPCKPVGLHLVVEYHALLCTLSVPYGRTSY